VALLANHGACMALAKEWRTHLPALWKGMAMSDDLKLAIAVLVLWPIGWLIGSILAKINERLFSRGKK